MFRYFSLMDSRRGINEEVIKKSGIKLENFIGVWVDDEKVLMT